MTMKGGNHLNPHIRHFLSYHFGLTTYGNLSTGTESTTAEEGTGIKVQQVFRKKAIYHNALL